MDKLVLLGRTFFALGIIGLGAAHVVFGEFVTGRAPPWPESVPGGTAWAYLTGVAFVVVGGAMLFGKKGRPAAVAAAALVFAWALLRHVPVLAGSSFLSGEWTRVGKALWLVGGSLAVATTFSPVRTRRDSLVQRFANLGNPLLLAGRVTIALFLVQSGIQHFLFTAFVASLIPLWFPGDPVFWTYFAAVALIAGGVGLLVPRTVFLAALLSGLMVFSWFWIVHVPRTLLTVSDGIAVFEALANSGLLLVLAGADPRGSVSRGSAREVAAPRPEPGRIS